MRLRSASFLLSCLGVGACLLPKVGINPSLDDSGGAAGQSASGRGGGTAGIGAKAGASDAGAADEGGADAGTNTGGASASAGQGAGGANTGGANTGGANTGGANTGGSAGGITAFPPGFWDTSGIPAATASSLPIKFLNKTGGKYTDDQISFLVKAVGTMNPVATLATTPIYSLGALNGRINVYLGDVTSAYADSVDVNLKVGMGLTFTGDTSRINGFGLKLALRLHCQDGTEFSVGEDPQTFAETRAATFAKYLAEVPAEFRSLVQGPDVHIQSPETGSFYTVYPDYYTAFIGAVWSANGITLPKPTYPTDHSLDTHPDLEAALFRHVGDVAGSFTPSGTLVSSALWAFGANFYKAAPANYYSKFWHDHSIGGKAYGFPYDDVGNYESSVQCANAQYLLVAIGW